MTRLKKDDETDWLQEAANQSLQQSIRHLDSAFTRFFREKKGFPQIQVEESSPTFAPVCSVCVSGL